MNYVDDQTMTLRWIVAALHLLALGVGLGAVWMRARALRALPEPSAFGRAFAADAAWGGAAALWIGTGLWRAFGGLEKGSQYYLQSTAFQIKMGLLLLILLLELLPMVTLIRWRVARKKGAEVDVRAAGRLATISYVQAALVGAMVFAATAMARGLGF
jgi:putative membrane protein